MKASIIYKLIKRAGCHEQILDKILEDRPDLSPNPVNKVHELEDTPGTCYIWNINGTDEQVVALNEQIRSKFTKTYNRPPKALHIVENNIENIENFPPSKIKEVVKPWLQNSEVEE